MIINCFKTFKAAFIHLRKKNHLRWWIYQLSILCQCLQMFFWHSMCYLSVQYLSWWVLQCLSIFFTTSVLFLDVPLIINTLGSFVDCPLIIQVSIYDFSVYVCRCSTNNTCFTYSSMSMIVDVALTLNVLVIASMVTQIQTVNWYMVTPVENLGASLHPRKWLLYPGKVYFFIFVKKA